MYETKNSTPAGPSERTPRKTARQATSWTLVVSALLMTLSGLGLTSCAESDAVAASTSFSDVRSQTLEFIGYNSSIQLTPEQEAIKKEALTALPAPCCSDNSAYTCCCPCNMAKSTWGLANHLIAEKGYGADEVQAAVQEWHEFINPAGFSGDVCYTGGCGRPFNKNGCGGMNENNVVF